MAKIIIVFHFLLIVFFTFESKADEIWSESFDVADKGYWGDADGVSINSDLNGILKWQVDISSCELTAETDYVKTTGTSGGRFEARDCDGEAIWTSEDILICDYKNVSIQLDVAETGSGATSTSKYLRVYYQIDGGPLSLLEENGESAGNFGSTIATQDSLNGDTLKIIAILYTSYASDKIIIDEIVVAGETKVTYSENHIDTVNVLSETEIKAIFSDSLLISQVTAENFQMIAGTNDTLQINSINKHYSAQNCIWLTAEEPSEINVRLVASGLFDVDTLPLKDDSIDFEWIIPCVKHSVIFTEIMPDPFPAVALPEYEYIEIYNRSANPVYLKRLQLSVNDKTVSLPDSVLEPGNYVILTSTIAAEYFSEAIAVTSFPTLTNDNGEILLTTEAGDTIDFLNYSADWYDETKKDGGWSLERIDNERFCGIANNWAASVNSNGGTPCGENSVAGDNQDNSAPEIAGYELISANCIYLSFSEDITLATLEATDNYSLSPGIGCPGSIEIIDNSTINLMFAADISANTSYTLSVSGLSDECGNVMQKQSVAIEWVQLSFSDILISEVLFNPYSGVSDFVEIYNNSDKAVNLKKMFLTDRDSEQNLEHVSQISSEDRWMYPKEFILCTQDSLSVISTYYTSCAECFCEMKKFPSLPDDEGTVVLVDDSLQVIDEFEYSEDMHHPLLSDVEGVSLERISYESETNNASIWHSAAASVGYATPGYENSQSCEELEVEAPITVSPEAFSPNNDGYNDRLFIYYQFGEAGYSANVRIYDSHGRLIKYLVKNKTLAQEGEWYWDGEKTDGNHASLGIYVIWIEVFDLEGHVKRYKEACTLTDRL